MRESVVHASLKGLLIKRAGRLRVEFNLERLIVVSRGDKISRYEKHLLVGDPRPCRNGRRALNFFQARLDFYPLPRASGHVGRTTSAYVFDGLMAAPLARHMKSAHAEWYTREHLQYDDHELTLMCGNEAVLNITCAAHGASLSVPWCMCPFGDEELVSDVHIAIESLRKTSVAIYETIPEFVYRYTVFDEEVPDLESLELWRSLGASGIELYNLVQAKLRWDGHVLHASALLATSTKRYGMVENAVLISMRWIQFVQTRWVKSTIATRLLTRSLLAGVDGLIAMVHANDKIGEDDFHGVSRLQYGVRRWAVVNSLGTLPSKNFLVEILRDDRLLRRFQEMETVLADSVTTVMQLREHIFIRLSEVVGGDCTPEKLRKWISEAAVTNHAFIDDHSMGQCRKFPLSLAVGSVPDNLQALCEMPADDVKEPIASAFRTEMLAGGDPGAILEQLEQWDEISFTATMSEQAHASGKVTVAAHPEISGEVLVGRACLHNQRPLFRLSKPQKAEARLLSQISRLESQQPFKISARHMFFKALAADITQLIAGWGFSGTRPCMIEHGKMFKELPRQAKAAYERDARAYAREKDERRLNKITELENDLRQHRHACKAAELASPPNHVTHFRFTNADLRKISKKLESSKFGVSNIMELRQHALVPPGTPIDAFVDTLLNVYKMLPPQPRPEEPWWIGKFCRNRDMFNSVALLFSRDGWTDAYLKLFASQSPQYAKFLLLKPSELPLPRLESLTEEQLANIDTLWPLHRFSYEPVTFVDSSTLPGADDEIRCLCNVRFNGSEFVSSQAPERFEVFTRTWVDKEPKPAKERGTDKDKVPKSLWDKFLEMYPFMKDQTKPAWKKYRHVRRKLRRLDGEETSSSSDSSSSASSTSSDESSSDSDPDPDLKEVISPVDLDGVAERLAKHRADYEWEEEAVTDFYVTQPGGKWLKRVHGIDQDSACYHGRAWVNTWCGYYLWPHSRQYFYTVYGQDGANYLARELCRKAQYFYNFFEQSEDDDFIYEDHHYAGFIESPEFGAYIAGLAPADPCVDAANAIRNLRPT